MQINFNLIDQRAIKNGLFAKCRKNNVAIIGRTPLCFGFLTGKYNNTIFAKTITEADGQSHKLIYGLQHISFFG